MAKNVRVYRFKRHENGRELCPAHMWGTLEAIASFVGCAPMLDTARDVDEAMIQDGFFFEAVVSRAIQIDIP